MKTQIKVFAAAAIALGVVGCASQMGRHEPSVVLATPVAEIKPGGKLMMYGTGFAPKQEVMVLLKDAGGGMSSIGSAMKPAPVANQDGSWAAEWNYSSYLKVLKPGTATLTVADKDFKTLGQVPVVFVAMPKPAPEAAKGGPTKGAPERAPARR